MHIALSVEAIICLAALGLGPAHMAQLSEPAAATGACGLEQPVASVALSTFLARVPKKVLRRLLSRGVRVARGKAPPSKRLMAADAAGCSGCELVQAEEPSSAPESPQIKEWVLAVIWTIVSSRKQTVFMAGSKRPTVGCDCGRRCQVLASLSFCARVRS
jgi:hypothetical protein